MMDSFIKFRWVWVLLLVVAAVVVSPGLPTAVEADNALTVWFLETDPQLQTYQEFHDEFGNDEVILMLLENESGIFEPDILREVEALSEELEDITGVARVHSILNVKDAWDTEEGLVFHSLIPTPIPEDPEVLEQAAQRTMQNPIFMERLVSEDGKKMMLWVQMDTMGNIDALRDSVVADVRNKATDRMGAENFAMGGVGVIYSGLNVLTEKDFGIFLSLSYLLMFLFMWWIFRSWRIVSAAIGVISIATLICLGVYGLFGHQLNMVSVVIPVLVIVLGIADAVHMPTTFLHLRKSDSNASRADRIKNTLRYVGIPSLLTTLTTMGSFLALTSSPMAVIRQLGIYSAIGVGAALVATIILMTLALYGISEKYTPPEHPYLERILVMIRGLLEDRRSGVAAGLVAVVLISAWGATLVEIDTYTIGYLPDSDPVVMDHHRLEDKWGPYSLLEFVIRPLDGKRIDDPEVLAATEKFVEQAVEHEGVHNGFSLADVYRRTAAVYMGDAEQWLDRSEPMTPAQVEQLSLLLSMQRLEWDKGRDDYDDNFMARLTTEERDLGRVTLTSDMLSAKELEHLFGWLDDIGEDTLGGIATLEAAGYPPLYVKIIDYVMTSKVRGFFLALGIIFLILLIGLRSFRLALISLPANIFPVLVMLGVMGFLSIDLDVGTATVAAIVIGISIDDSVHFLYHWKSAEERGLSWEECVRYAFRHAGMAALITTVILVGGFPVLMLASVKTVFYFGILTTIAAAAALIADLFLLPLLLRVFSQKVPAQGTDGQD